MVSVNPLKILIIDDEAEISRLLTRFLERRGFAVKSAGTISEGLAMCQLESYRYLILDINLPDGNGLENLPYFKNLQPACEVIMISAMANPQLTQESRQKGAMTMLGKPFSSQSILSLLGNSAAGRK
jgi:DNA-binding NtrC family response regulator